MRMRSASPGAASGARAGLVAASRSSPTAGSVRATLRVARDARPPWSQHNPLYWIGECCLPATIDSTKAAATGVLLGQRVHDRHGELLGAWPGEEVR